MLYNKETAVHLLHTVLALNFIDNGVCTKMYSFFQSCTNSLVIISIFLKSCTTIKMLYYQKEKLNIFGILFLALNFIENGVCTKMYSFFQSCAYSVVIICIFSKSCTSLVHSKWLLSFIDSGICTKMYGFFESCTNSVVLICIFVKSCTTIKTLYNQRKKLYIFGTHCPWLLILLTMVFAPKCTVFPKLYEFCGPLLYIFKKLYNQREKLYIFGILFLALNFIHNGVCTKMYSFSKAVQILWSSYVYF